MTRQALRVFLQSWFCGCGSPELAAATLCQLLSLHPLYDHRAEIDALIPHEGIQELMLYTLDRFRLTQHGGSIGGAWLTDKGQQVLEALRREEFDAFETLMQSNCCIDGYDDTETCPHCAALNTTENKSTYTP